MVKKEIDKSRLLNHTILCQLYDAINDSSNALREFLTARYFMVNYLDSQKWLEDDLQYLPFSQIANNIYMNAKDCHVIVANDATYLSHHSGFNLNAMVDSIYDEYPLKHILFPKDAFLSMLFEMQHDSPFNFEKWDYYALTQLANFLKLS